MKLCNVKTLSNSTHKLPCANSRFTRNISTTLRFLFSFFPDTSSVWINSIVKATGDIFSLDKHQCCCGISQPRSTFSLDKQYCDEADWLSIQALVEKDFQIHIGKGYLINLLGEVRCYQVITFGTLRAEFDIELRRTSSVVFKL
ncbi:hypothetical protein ACFX2I_017875 [Malus domestica]